MTAASLAIPEAGSMTLPARMAIVCANAGHVAIVHTAKQDQIIARISFSSDLV
jgi:hypothetical protein